MKLDQLFLNNIAYHLHNHISMLVVHSEDDKGVYMAHEITSPKKQPKFSQMMMGQY